MAYNLVFSTQSPRRETRPLGGLLTCSRKLFFKKKPLILLALVWGGATPATPNVFGNCFLLHPVNKNLLGCHQIKKNEHSTNIPMPRFVYSRKGKANKPVR